MEEIAKLKALFTADTSKFDKALTSVDDKLQGIAKGLSSTGDKLKKWASDLAPVSALAAGALGGMVKVASDFNGAMVEIGARAGLTGDELAKVSDFAIKMGADTKFSAQEAADGLLQLLTSGQSVEQAMATLPAVMDLAAASGIDLGYAADTVTDIMSQFGIQTDHATDVVDALSAAAASSSTDVPMLADALKNVGAVAAQQGLSQWDTTAALAVLAENGLKGADAGTQLKSMLMNLNSDAGQSALKKLGIAMYDAKGNARPLADVLKEIKTKLDGMSDESRIKFVKDLGGAYGQTALLALTGDKSIGSMSETMGKQATAAQVAAQMNQTFAGKMDALKGSIEAVLIKAGIPFLDNFLTPLATKVTEIVNSVGDWVTKNPELTATIAQVMAGLAVAAPILGVVGWTLSTMSGIIGILTPIVGGLALAFSGLLLPLAPILLILGLIGGLIMAYTNNWGGFRDGVDALTDAFKRLPSSISAAMNKLKEIGKALLSVILIPIKVILQAYQKLAELAGDTTNAALAAAAIGEIDKFRGEAQAAQASGGGSDPGGGGGGGGTSFHATGGWMRKGETSWVGERGPELVTAGSRSYVSTAHKSAAMAGGGVSINGPVSIYGVTDVESMYDALNKEGQRRNR